MSTVLITGSSKGIGAATAEKFARVGYNVILNYIKSESECLELMNRLKAITNCIAIRADISVEDDRRRLVAESLAYFGGIDVLVNNAGISDTAVVTDMSTDRIEKLVSVNLIGAMCLTNLILPHMIAKKNGSIVNVSSVWGVVGASCEVVYSATKAGLIGYTKALAKELAPSGIRVNCVAPGVIDTEMNSHLTMDDRLALESEIPIGRYGTPTEVAESIYYLASPLSSYVTGQVLGVDGGF